MKLSIPQNTTMDLNNVMNVYNKLTYTSIYLSLSIYIYNKHTPYTNHVMEYLSPSICQRSCPMRSIHLNFMVMLTATNSDNPNTSGTLPSPFKENTFISVQNLWTTSNSTSNITQWIPLSQTHQMHFLLNHTRMSIIFSFVLTLGMSLVECGTFLQVLHCQPHTLNIVQVINNSHVSDTTFPLYISTKLENIIPS